MSLHRCATCGDFTTLGPLLMLRRWKMHLPVCFDCTQKDDEAIDSVVFLRPAHREPWRALLALFVTGAWCWDLPGDG